MKAKLFILTLFLAIAWSVDLTQWELVLTNTAYLVLNENTAWRLDASGGTAADYPMQQFSYSTQSWTSETGQGLTLSLSSQAVYATDSAQNIYQRAYTDTVWSLMTIKGPDIKVGSGGTIGYIDSSSGKPFIYPSSTAAVPTVAQRVAVNKNGKIWYVSPDGIYTKILSTITFDTTLRASDILIGNDVYPYIVVSNSVATDDGYQIQKVTSYSNGPIAFELVSGIEGIALALDSNDNLYVVTKKHEVYRKKGITTRFCPEESGTYLDSTTGFCASEIIKLMCFN